MPITAQLKKWLIEKAGVKEDATDDECRKAAGDAVVDGKLTVEKLAELTSDPEAKEADVFAAKLDAIAAGLGKLTETLVKEKTSDKEAEEKKKEVEEAAVKTKKDAEEKATKEAEEKAQKEKSQPSLTELSKMIARMGGTPDGVDGDKRIDVRVKEAAERYDDTKSVMTYPAHNKSGRTHPLAGRPVTDFTERSRIVNTPSQRDMAVCGSFAKFLCATAQRGGSRTFGFQSLPQHDKELLHYAMEKMEWGGASDGGDFADICNRRLTSMEQKQLIDDATSGGLEAAPIVFDDQVIQAPLLNGELFPLVNVIPLDRGRRVEGVSTGTVTGSWGGVDDTAITLFTTTAYVTAFDTTIYRWEGAIRIGLDFLSDTPIDFGQHITAQYGERLLEDLDDVVAAGNGTDRPQGVINATGITTVAWGGATSIGNYESLRFSVTKQEHGAAVKASSVFCGTETSYMRARALPVGAADARRLGGMDYDSYSWMERPYKINATLANTQIFYAVLARYRMYRRRGLFMRTSTEGDTLIRRNELLMIAMCRYGGQMERGAAAAVTTTAPA